MNRNEYLQRVFEGQVNSLKREVEQYENQIEHLEGELKEANLNLTETLQTLEYAENEMRKLK